MLSCTCKLMLCMLLSNGKNFSLSIQLFLQLLPNYRSRYVISLAAVYLFYKIPNFVSNLQLRCFPLLLLVTTHDNLLTSVECLSLLCMYMETLSRTLYSLVSTFFKLLSFLLFYFIFSDCLSYLLALLANYFKWFFVNYIDRIMERKI